MLRHMWTEGLVCFKIRCIFKLQNIFIVKNPDILKITIFNYLNFYISRKGILRNSTLISLLDHDVQTHLKHNVIKI